MKKLVLTVILLVGIMLCGTTVANAESEKKKIYDFDYETKDGFIVKSTLTYPQINNQKYSMVVLLHSLGYSSEEWGMLKFNFNKAGLAVLEIDFKGHGKSMNDVNFKRRSWIYLQEKSFEDFPKEVHEVVKNVLTERKDIAPNFISYVGADIGANTAIISAKLQTPKPVCMVLISPAMNFKGLYVPIELANAGNVPILAIAASKDLQSVKQLSDLQKYAQGSFEQRIYKNGGTGMLMLKQNKSMTVDIVNWVVDTINLKVNESNPTETNKNK